MTEAKTIGGVSLCLLWFGAAVSLAEIMTGSLIAPLGIKTGIAIILLGHLIGTLILACTGIIGFKEKKPSLISSRLSLGSYGSYLVSLFNIIQLIGWTAIMIIQCSRALQPISGKLLGVNNFTVLVIFTGVLVGFWALSKNSGIDLINNIAVILLLVLCLMMFKTILGGGQIKPVSGTMTAGMALELSIVMPLSWVPLISDYTMLGKSAKGSFLGSFAGYFIGSSFMYIIGLLLALYTGTSDPVAALGNLHLGYAALLIIILSTVTTTFMDVYSAVMSTLNLTDRFSREKLIIIFTIIGTILAVYFPMEKYENFLYMIGSLFAPAFSVILVDYFIYRRDRSEQLFNVPGIIAIVAGIVAYYAVTPMNLIIGSTIPTMLITILVYALLRFCARFYENTAGVLKTEANKVSNDLKN